MTDFVEPPNERIQYWTKQIMTHPDWLRDVREKARQKGATFDDVLWDEASWVAEQEMHR